MCFHEDFFSLIHMDVVWVLNSLVNGELQDITATVLNLFESKVRWPFLSLLFG